MNAVAFVREFQGRAGLERDGVPGPLTYGALDRILPVQPGVDPILLAHLKRDEGLRLQAYPDPLSPLAAEMKRLRVKDYRAVPRWREFSGAPWTIGYGHAGPDVFAGLEWTESEAEAALVKDIDAHNATLARVLPWVADLPGPRRRVLQNMHFNMGWDNPRTPKLEGLAGFTRTLADVQAGRYAEAADRMALSLWAKQTGNRARRLIATMRDGRDR